MTDLMIQRMFTPNELTQVVAVINKPFDFDELQKPNTVNEFVKEKYNQDEFERKKQQNKEFTEALFFLMEEEDQLYTMVMDYYKNFNALLEEILQTQLEQEKISQKALQATAPAELKSTSEVNINKDLKEVKAEMEKLIAAVVTAFKYQQDILDQEFRNPTWDQSLVNTFTQSVYEGVEFATEEDRSAAVEALARAYENRPTINSLLTQVPHLHESVINNARELINPKVSPKEAFQLAAKKVLDFTKVMDQMKAVGGLLAADFSVAQAISHGRGVSDNDTRNVEEYTKLKAKPQKNRTTSEDKRLAELEKIHDAIVIRQRIETKINQFAEGYSASQQPAVDNRAQHFALGVECSAIVHRLKDNIEHLFEKSASELKSVMKETAEFTTQLTEKFEAKAKAAVDDVRTYFGMHKHS